MVKTATDDDGTVIVLTPNRSLDWQQVRPWLIILSLPAMIVALGWLAMGVWIILPFAGIELGLLTWFMYKICYQNYRQQQIHIDQQHVSVASGIHTPLEKHTYPREDCFLDVTRPQHPIENLQLTLSCSDAPFTIGDFLNQEEREQARQAIVRAGLIECSNRWWETNR